MKLIVGLGNPTEQYAHTRHNAGFFVVDTLAETLGAAWSVKSKFKADIAEHVWSGQKVLLLKPTTYYNLSGEAVMAVANFYKIPVNHIIVIHDELALPFGTIRLRHAGTDAGNNGIKSAINHLGSDFTRVRVGIAPDHPYRDAAAFVLGRFTIEESQLLPKVADNAINLIHQWLHDPHVATTTLKITA